MILHQDPEDAPMVDLAPPIRRMCQIEWAVEDGSMQKLLLRLDSVLLPSWRTVLLCEAARCLLRGGLSAGFSPRGRELGVHLWRASSLEAILLLADDGDILAGEPATADAARARFFAAQADCRLIWVPARGAVWRIHIPLLDQEAGS